MYLSRSKGPGVATVEPPSPERSDVPTSQGCLEVGSPSSPPEDVKHVLPESVVLSPRDVVVPEPAPVEPPRAEEVQEAEQQVEELSRYEQGLYNDDFLLGPIPGEIEYEEVDEGYDPETDPENADPIEYSPETDPEDEDPIEDDPEEEDPIEDDPEGRPRDGP